MGLDRITALEIFAHPRDLNLFVGVGETITDKFGFMISRGPGHDYKPLVSSKVVFEKREAAVKVMVDILKASVEEGKRTYEGNDLAGQVLNPDRDPVRDFPAMTNEFVGVLEALLARQDEVETHLLPPAAG